MSFLEFKKIVPNILFTNIFAFYQTFLYFLKKLSHAFRTKISKTSGNILLEITIISGTDETFNARLFVSEIKSDIAISADVIRGCFHFLEALCQNEKRKEKDKR